VEPEPEAVAAVELEPVAAVEPELEPVAAEPEPEPELVAAAEPAAVAEPEPEPVAAAAEPEPPAPPVSDGQPPVAPREDRVEMPAWRIVAPDGPAAADGHPGPSSDTQVPIAAHAETQWPATPEWPNVPTADTEALAFLTAKLTRSGEDLWAASNREVLSAPEATAAAPAIQACVSCGLALSANARFCRRCGTRQG
jgi:hypothetical protein